MSIVSDSLDCGTSAAETEAAVEELSPLLRVREEAASGGDVSFVLLLLPVDVCAEASKKNKHDGDDNCW